MLITSWVYPWIWNWESWWWRPAPASHSGSWGSVQPSDCLSCILWFTILFSWELTITLGCLSGTSPDVQRDRNRDTWNLSNQNKEGFICNPIIIWLQKKKQWLKRKWEWRCLKEAETFWGLMKRKSSVELHRISFFPLAGSRRWSAGPPHAGPPQHSWGWCFPHPQACHVRLGAKDHDGSLIQDKALGVGRHCAPCSPSLGSTSSGCLLTRRTGTPPGGKSCTELPLTSPQKHTYSSLTVVKSTIRHLRVGINCH